MLVWVNTKISRVHVDLYVWLKFNFIIQTEYMFLSVSSLILPTPIHSWSIYKYVVHNIIKIYVS